MLGWVKLHRCLMEKPIWTESTPEQKTILITLVMMANHQGKEWEWKGEKYKADPGEFVTSLESITKKSGKGVSIQNVRTALKRFEKYEFLTSKPTNKNRLINIVNWGIYQGNEDEPNKQLTSNQQATNKQLTTNKNEKNDKNEKKDTSCQKFKYEPSDMELAKLLFDYIQDNGDKAYHLKNSEIESWANTIRLMRTRDKRTHEGIKYLIDWTQKDEFWKTVILSPSKLREKFDQLIIKVKQQREKQQKTPSNQVNTTPKLFDPNSLMED